MNHIYIVRYLDADGWYAPYDLMDRDLENAKLRVAHLKMSTGKCFGIVTNGELVYESSRYYADAHLPIRND